MCLVDDQGREMVGWKSRVSAAESLNAADNDGGRRTGVRFGFLFVSCDADRPSNLVNCLPNQLVPVRQNQYWASRNPSLGDMR